MHPRHCFQANFLIGAATGLRATGCYRDGQRFSGKSFAHPRPSGPGRFEISAHCIAGSV